MIQAKCIQKFRDYNGKIYGYKLQDINGQTQDVYATNLKIAIKSNKIHVVNLKLTTDGRLVDTSEKILQNKKILGKPISKSDKYNKKRLEHMQDVANDYATELIFALAHYFSISVQDVLKVFDTINYWKIINDDEACCLLAHNGIKNNIKEIEDEFNEVLSRNK